MSRILVLGGSGFIGEPLVNALRKAGESVTAPTIEEIDIAKEQGKLAEAMRNHDTLVILTQPNEQGIINIVSALALSHITHVLYASTSFVYGSSRMPQRETAPISPGSDYAHQKYSEEEALRKSGVPLTITRLGNVYGGLKNRGVVQKAIQALYEHTPIETSGEDQVRDFIHVDDVVCAMCVLLKIPPKGFRVVNVMTGIGTTVGDMLSMIERLTGKTLLKTVEPTGIHLHLVGNADELKRITGFFPKILLEEGLKNTIKTYERSIQK